VSRRFKRAYEEFKARGLRARLLVAAFRNTLQISEFIGGDLVISPPFSWQQRFQNGGSRPEPRMDIPVEPRILDALSTMPEFVKAYEPDGLTPASSCRTFGATAPYVASVPDRGRGARPDRA
jgi:transaldolase